METGWLLRLARALRTHLSVHQLGRGHPWCEFRAAVAFETDRACCLGRVSYLLSWCLSRGDARALYDIATGPLALHRCAADAASSRVHCDARLRAVPRLRHRTGIAACV